MLDTNTISTTSYVQSFCFLKLLSMYTLYMPMLVSCLVSVSMLRSVDFHFLLFIFIWFVVYCGANSYLSVQFVDDDRKCYLDASYRFEIQKNWPTPH